MAEGTLDAYSVVGTSTLFGWDYLAGMLICTEAGAVTKERDGARRRGARRRDPSADRGGDCTPCATELLAKTDM